MMLLRWYVRWQAWRACQEGQTMTEYILISALVAVGLILVFTDVGKELGKTLHKIKHSLTAANEASY